MPDFFAPPQQHDPNKLGPFEKTIDELLIEVAYHEAGHFVIGRLVSSISPEFNQPKKISICVKPQLEFNNCVTTPTTEKLKRLDGEDPIQFIQRVYNEQYLERCFYQLISILSGFSTYRIFYQKADKFIHYPFSGKKTIMEEIVYVEYITIKRILCNLASFKGHDISSSSEIIKYGLNISTSEIEKVIKFIIEELDLIINRKVIKESIEIVKTTCVENNSKDISSYQIDSLNSIVKEKIKKIDLNEHIAKFKLFIENM